MIFHINVNSETRAAIYRIVAAFSQVKKPAEIETDGSKEAELIRSFLPNSTSISRFHILDLVGDATDVTPKPDAGYVFADFRARTIEEQSIINNVYWYTRDASTPGHITFVLSDDASYDKIAKSLSAQEAFAKEKFAAFVKSDDGKSVAPAQKVIKAILAGDGFSVWSWKSNLDLRALTNIVRTISRRQKIAAFSDAEQLHTLLYGGRENVLSVAWAYFLGYESPFTGNTKKGGDNAVR